MFASEWMSVCVFEILWEDKRAFIYNTCYLFLFLFFYKKTASTSVHLFVSFSVVCCCYADLWTFTFILFFFIYIHIRLYPIGARSQRPHFSILYSPNTSFLPRIHKSNHTCTPRFSRPFLNTSPICTYFKIYPFRLHSSALYTLFVILISSRSFFYHAVTYLVPSI